MTLSDLQFDIEKVNHSKASRAHAVNLVVDHLEVIPELVDRAFSDEKNHFKYCWWLEFLNRQHIEVLCPYMEIILEKAQHLTNQSAIRPIAKIIETFVLNNYSKNPNNFVRDMMTSTIKEMMVSRGFEWLIDDQLKVAPRAYSMTSLYHLGKDIDWVHEELKLVIEQNYAHESVAYQARGRMILKKLK
ncbi:hypothetical protein ACFQ1O_06070 [Pseudofulvibacter geojedonensis]|uniref:Adenylosuccinate lyase n=2 Tax=Pseudofulvibacter geojedonensis TaxID=1123758 RepID=A0ABW3I1U2_9FLAO